MARSCFHCSEPLPAGLAGDFCCTGCEAAAQWIRDARLDDYYRLRSEPASRVGTEMPDLAAWDREELLAGHARDVELGGTPAREITVLTDGMHCAACAWLIDRALAREDGVLESSANAVTGRIRIAWDPARTPLSRLLGRLAALGYRPYLAAGEERERARRRVERVLDQLLGLGGASAVAVVLTRSLRAPWRSRHPRSGIDRRCVRRLRHRLPHRFRRRRSCPSACR